MFSLGQLKPVHFKPEITFEEDTTFIFDSIKNPGHISNPFHSVFQKLKNFCMRKLNFEQKTKNFMYADAFRLMTTKITTKYGINFETISCITDFRIMLNYDKTEILGFLQCFNFFKFYNQK